MQVFTLKLHFSEHGCILEHERGKRARGRDVLLQVTRLCSSSKFVKRAILGHIPIYVRRVGTETPSPTPSTSLTLLVKTVYAKLNGIGVLLGISVYRSWRCDSILFVF